MRTRRRRLIPIVGVSCSCFSMCRVFGDASDAEIHESAPPIFSFIMKKFFFSLVALVCATMCFAQSSRLATLSHDGKVSTFYGASALRDAHDAASNGDIITLSSGSFNAVTIKKALTIRGAGMLMDTVNATLPTIITGDFNIEIPDTVSQHLTLEGIYSNHNITVYNILQSPKFLKCRFKEFRTPSNNDQYNVVNAQFIHCNIINELSLTTNSSASLINCVIYSTHCDNSNLINCIVKRAMSIFSSTLYNCILGSGNLSSNDIAYNCVGIDGKYMFSYVPQNNTNKLSTYEEVFKTYRGGNVMTDSDNFELTDEAKKKFLGIDDTEVGIYGGMLPYDPTPSNPQITKCNVAKKSTADGKLSVDIEVKAAE